MAIPTPPVCNALQDTSASALLRGLSNRTVRDRFRPEALRARIPGEHRDRIAPRNLMHAFHTAEDEIDSLGDIGITVAFKEVKVLDDQDDLFSGSGEIYVVTSLLDGSGKQPSFKTKVFEGINSGDRLPLGDGGMLLGMLENPRWFVDMHMLVMESDADIREVGAAVEQARRSSGLSDAVETIGGLATFNPDAVDRVAGAVDVFLRLLSSLLRANDDDHVATVHDFYLKSQAYGAGRHPRTGLQRFQDVDCAYQIDLLPLAKRSSRG